MSNTAFFPLVKKQQKSEALLQSFLQQSLAAHSQNRFFLVKIILTL